MLKDFTDTPCKDYLLPKFHNFLKGILILYLYYIRTTVDETIKSLKADCNHKAELAKKFVDEVSADILEPLHVLLVEHKALQKKTDSTWHGVESTYHEKKVHLEHVKANYFASYKALDEGILAYDSNTDKSKMSPEKKIRLNQKITQLLVNCKTREKEYMNNVYGTKDARLEYIKGLSYLLDKHQRFEEDRLELIKDKLRLFYLKSIELSTKRKEVEESYTKSVEKISKELEVSAIISKIASEPRKIEEIVFTRATTKYEDILKRFDSMYSKGEPISSFNFEETRIALQSPERDDSNSAPGSGASPRLLKKVLSDCWSSTETAAGKMSEFKEIIKTPLGRRHFCECLNHYRTQGLFSMPTKAFTFAAKLLSSVLDETHKTDDVDCALRILILSQTYYTEITGKSGKLDRVYLQQSIQTHPIWVGKEFWEKAIRASIQEDKDTQVSHKETSEERGLRLQSLVFGKLGTFAHNMIQFGIDKAIVETAIFSHAKENSLSPELIDALHVNTSFANKTK